MPGITVSFETAYYSPLIHTLTHSRQEVRGAPGFALQFSGLHEQSDLYFDPVGVPLKETISFTDAAYIEHQMQVHVFMYKDDLTILSVRSGGLTWAMGQPTVNGAGELEILRGQPSGS